MNLLYVPLFFLQIYAGDLDASIAVLQKNYNLVQKVSSKFDVNRDKVLSIVAPEISRWVSFNDYVETKALELLYISKGYEYCNFSIGYFQMKPKFIEDLEDYIRKNDLGSSYSLKDLLINRDIPIKKQRKIRLKRLKSFEWQLIYAYAFYVIAEHRFRNIRFENDHEKLKFFATAYNTGFMKPVNVIRDKMFECSFPYGENSNRPQDNYGDLAYCFYKDYANQLDDFTYENNNNKKANNNNYFSSLLLLLFAIFLFKYGNNLKIYRQWLKH